MMEVNHLPQSMDYSRLQTMIAMLLLELVWGRGASPIIQLQEQVKQVSPRLQ